MTDLLKLVTLCPDIEFSSQVLRIPSKVVPLEFVGLYMFEIFQVDVAGVVTLFIGHCILLVAFFFSVTLLSGFRLISG